MSNLTIGGLDEQQGYYSYVETYGGGQGAKSDQDGMDGVHVNMTNTMNTPVEAIESSYPLRVDKYSLLPDTGGPGQFRGGTGLVRQIALLREATVSLSTERNRLQPWGLQNGRPGKPARCFLQNTAGLREDIAGKTTRQVPAGSAIILETAGGGGFGPPEKREPAALRQDLANGLVSEAAAKEAYGRQD